jgi:hypothetical protein
MSKLYNIQGTRITNAITIGNKTVQQKDINWSKRILGKDALDHINMNIIMHDFTPKVKLCKNPCVKASEKRLSLCKFCM